MEEAKKQDQRKTGKAEPAMPPRKRNNPPGQRRCSDRELTWVERDYPELCAWSAVAKDWLRGETEAVHVRL